MVNLNFSITNQQKLFELMSKLESASQSAERESVKLQKRSAVQTPGSKTQKKLQSRLDSSLE